jgi:lysophospholipase L1-like esterase
MSRLDQQTPGYGRVAVAPTRGFVALGDSLTAWAFAPASCRASVSLAWPSVLAQLEPGLTLLHNSGVPGDTTAEMVARFKSDVLAYRPDVLFVMGGANDVGSHWSASYTVANLRTIVRAAKSRGIEVVLLTIPPNNEIGPSGLRALRATNKLLSQMGAEEGVLVVDVYSSLVSSSGGLARQYAAIDGLHLTIRAEEKIAQVVFDALEAAVPGQR